MIKASFTVPERRREGRDLVRRVVHQRLGVVAVDVDVVHAEQVVLPDGVPGGGVDPLEQGVAAVDPVAVAVLRRDVVVQRATQAGEVPTVDGGRVPVDGVGHGHPVGQLAGGRQGHRGFLVNGHHASTDDDGYVTIRDQVLDVPDDQVAGARDAADTCPEAAITILDD